MIFTSFSLPWCVECVCPAICALSSRYSMPNHTHTHTHTQGRKQKDYIKGRRERRRRRRIRTKEMFLFCCCPASVRSCINHVVVCLCPSLSLSLGLPVDTLMSGESCWAVEGDSIFVFVFVSFFFALAMQHRSPYLRTFLILSSGRKQTNFYHIPNISSGTFMEKKNKCYFLN